MDFIKESIDHVVFDLELAELYCKAALIVTACYKRSNTVMQDLHNWAHLFQLVLMRSLRKAILSEVRVMHRWWASFELLWMRVQDQLVITVGHLMVHRAHFKLLLGLVAAWLMSCPELGNWHLDRLHCDVCDFDALIIIYLKWLVDNFWRAFNGQALSWTSVLCSSLGYWLFLLLLALFGASILNTYT